MFAIKQSLKLPSLTTVSWLINAMVASLAGLALLAMGIPEARAASPKINSTAELWVTPDRLHHLARTAPAWTELNDWAEQAKIVTLHRREENADVALLAATYVAIATDDSARRSELRAMVLDSMGTEIGPSRGNGDGETLALARNLPGLLISAKLLGVVEQNVDFRAWAKELLDQRIGSQNRSLRSTHEDRANNWGTHAGAARLILALLLDDQAEVLQVSRVFRGWLGERDAYSGFRYGALDWQANPNKPVGINPPGTTIRGHSVDGVLPEEQRRTGSFRWPPRQTDYNWEALQGAVLQAQLLSDHGFPAWSWGDRAILRTVRWLLTEADDPPKGDDLWILPLLDTAYGTTLSADYIRTQGITTPGKAIGFTRLTHDPALLPSANLAVVASVLPSSRSAKIGESVTAFATVIATATVNGCRVTLPQQPSGLSMNFRPRDSLDETWLGAPNVAFSLLANKPLQLVLEITATRAIEPTELAFDFRCAGSVAPSVSALNTLLFTATATSQPDIVFLTATAESDGTLALPQDGSYAFFSAAAVNLGRSAALTISANAVGEVTTNALVCPTDARTGVCLTPATPTVVSRFEADATASFAIFMRHKDGIEFLPAQNRLLLQATDSQGIVRGRGSVALR